MPSIAKQHFLLIFQTTFKLFQLNPQKNAFILGVFSFTISVLELDPTLAIWLEENYSNFNKFLIQAVKEFKDPDIIKQFASVEARILLYNELIFLDSNEYEEIISILLESLLNINEYVMTKEILLFFNTFVGATKGVNHPKMLKILPDIIKTFLFILPEINRNFLIYEIHVFQALIKNYGVTNNELYVFMRATLNDERFKDVTEKQKVFMSVFSIFF